jgi:hypothetical protein
MGERDSPSSRHTTKSTNKPILEYYYFTDDRITPSPYSLGSDKPSRHRAGKAMILVFSVA